MKAEKFEDLLAWQKAQDLHILVHEQFKGVKDCSFKGQLYHSAVAVSNYIAAGFDRKTKPDLKHNLVLALGHLRRFKSMILLAEKMERLTYERSEFFIKQADTVSELISIFIASIDRNRFDRAA